VSNFQVHQLRQLLDETSVVPTVNQIELHPYVTQETLRSFDTDDPVIRGLAQGYGRTSSQVVLRWHIQLGNIVFPKSISASRMRENFEIFDFGLSDRDMASISALNREERTGPDPDVFNWIPGRRRAGDLHCADDPGHIGTVIRLELAQQLRDSGLEWTPGRATGS
jgi:2,5-diketo-D-gluconate reductase A